MARLSTQAIFDRLGVPHRDADYELVACSACGQQSLIDHEVLRVYPDPHDLSLCFLDVTAQPWPACRGCGQADWDFVPASDAAPEWRWACRPAK